MSTNSGGDGLGGAEGGKVAAAAGEEILDDPGYASGGEFELDPATTLGMEPPEGEGAGGDPFEGAPDELKELAQRKGWKTPLDAAKAYAGAEELLGRRDSERDGLVEQNRQLARLIEQFGSAEGAGADGAGAGEGRGGGQAEAEGGWAIDFARLAHAAGDDPAEMMRIYHENVLPEVMRDFGTHLLAAVNKDVDTRVEPVSRYVGKATVRDEALALAQKFPKDFPRFKDEIVEKVRTGRASSISGAFYELYANEKVEREAARARGSEGETLVGTGGPRRGGQKAAPDVAAETRDAIESAILSVADGLS